MDGTAGKGINWLALFAIGIATVTIANDFSDLAEKLDVRAKERPEGRLETLRVGRDHPLQEIVVRCAGERLMSGHEVPPGESLARITLSVGG